MTAPNSDSVLVPPRREGMPRDVQLSLVPGHDKGVGAMPLSVVHGLNADLIAGVAGLYLTGSVLDVTYGRGMWWTRFQPHPFGHHDLAQDGVDFRALPHADGSWHSVCFDPPYLPRHGPSDAPHVRDQDFRERYGLDESRSRAELERLVAEGLAECGRVAQRWVLAKCTDYCNGGRLWPAHIGVVQAGEKAGLILHDLIVHASGTGPGGGQITTVRRSRRAHSYLLVFRVGGRRDRT